MLYSALIFGLSLVSAVSKNLPTQPQGISPAARGDPIPTNEWAGAILPGDFTEVTAIINVPVPQGSKGSAGSVWVGIDGTNFCQGLLRTGVSFSLDDNSIPVYTAWHEWREPGSTAIPYEDFTFTAGDMIRLTAFIYNPTFGYVKVENLSYNSMNNVSMRLVGSQSAPLCGKSAEWILEEYSEEDENGSVAGIPFVNFGSVTFTEATAIGSNGPITPGNGAQPVKIVSNSIDVSIDGSSVTVRQN